MLVGPYAVGRVIARPFVGKQKGLFKRTGNRRDFSLEPKYTVLDVLKASGHDVIAVGKIEDIFAGKGITQSNHASGNAACIESMLEYLNQPFNGLCFVNLVDTDMLYGHRRDVQGYANALMDFDTIVPEVKDALNSGDLLIITADHGCDPTHHGTDHTREYVPVLAWKKGMKQLTDLGVRSTFADIAATISEYFNLNERFGAISFLKEII
jgi:phosphopentomutase